MNTKLVSDLEALARRMARRALYLGTRGAEVKKCADDLNDLLAEHAAPGGRHVVLKFRRRVAVVRLHPHFSAVEGFSPARLSSKSIAEVVDLWEVRADRANRQLIESLAERRCAYRNGQLR